jgi:hypothetical protein
MSDPVEIVIYIAVIVDSGVTMHVEACGSVEEAERAIADYFNSKDEMIKYGRTQKSLPGPMINSWIDRNPHLDVSITQSTLRFHDG